MTTLTLPVLAEAVSAGIDAHVPAGQRPVRQMLALCEEAGELAEAYAAAVAPRLGRHGDRRGFPAYAAETPEAVLRRFTPYGCGTGAGRAAGLVAVSRPVQAAAGVACVALALTAAALL